MQIQPDGAIHQWCYNGINVSSQTNCRQPTVSATGNWVDEADESGLDWQQFTDVLGRLTTVVEPNGSSSAPSMETDYVYTLRGDLTSVRQCGGPCPSANVVTRSFNYDSLSRLQSAANPESGTTTYTYDANGNVLQKVSPAVNAASGTVTLGYCYDALNRPTFKFYASPPSNCAGAAGYAASYTYDASSISGASNVVGKLTDEQSYVGGLLVAESSPFVYDQMGRLKSELQSPYAPSGVQYTMNYSYDTAGGLTASNNGLSDAAHALAFGFTFDGNHHLAGASVSTQPSTWGSAAYPSILLQGTAYDPMSHLVGAQMAAASTNDAGAINISRTYDKRGRLSSEVDEGLGSSSATPAQARFAVIGGEQSTVLSQTPFSTPGSATLQVTGASTGIEMGSITVTVNGISPQM